MLVLSRFIGEWIDIGDDIRICIVDVRNHNQVRVGIEAPKKVVIHRREVTESIREQREHQ